MNTIPEQTLAEIYELSEVTPQVIMLQCQFAARHSKEAATMKEASRVWGRKAKTLARAWNTFGFEFERGLSLHESLSIILIAGLPEPARTLLHDEWRSHTLSYSDVRERVESLSKRKSKAAKVDTAKLFALLTECRRVIFTYAFDENLLARIDDALAQE